MTKSVNREKVIPPYFANSGKERRIYLTRYADWLDQNSLNWEDEDALADFSLDYAGRLNQQDLFSHIRVIAERLNELGVNVNADEVFALYLEENQDDLIEIETLEEDESTQDVEGTESLEG